MDSLALESFQLKYDGATIGGGMVPPTFVSLSKLLSFITVANRLVE